MSFIDHKYKAHERKALAISEFLSKRGTGPADSCWEWPGLRLESGYGRFGRWRAHVVSWELHHGKSVPVGMFVCHRCDNPPCCNPDHLFLGTHQDNVDDKMSKGRHRCGRGERPSIRGDNHWTRRVNYDSLARAACIRACFASGASVSELMRMFRIGNPQVHRALDDRL